MKEHEELFTGEELATAKIGGKNVWDWLLPSEREEWDKFAAFVNDKVRKNNISCAAKVEQLEARLSANYADIESGEMERLKSKLIETEKQRDAAQCKLKGVISGLDTAFGIVRHK